MIDLEHALNQIVVLANSGLQADSLRLKQWHFEQILRFADYQSWRTALEIKPSIDSVVHYENTTADGRPIHKAKRTYPDGMTDEDDTKFNRQWYP